MRFVSLIVLAAMAATPALAQVAKPAKPAASAASAASEQQLCLYNHLSDKTLNTIRMGFVSGETADKKSGEAAQTELASKQAVCDKLFTYTEQQRSLSQLIALHTAVSDLAYTKMVQNGFKDVGKVLTLWRGLEMDELNAFLKPEWRKDDKFRNALKTKLIAAGVPDKPVLIESAQILLEQTTQNAAAFDQWSAGKAPAADAKTAKP